MKVGIIGLGRMGMSIAMRLHNARHDVVGYDPAVSQADISVVASVQELAQQVRLFWLMVPSDVVDQTLASLEAHFQPGDIVIDGGNSFFKDSVRRAETLKQKNVIFIDCGTSGGVHGATQGYSLMVGGDRTTVEALTPIFEALAAPSGFAYMGPSGAGHYVKMVHNGIEYATLQAYAEGFHLLKDGVYKDLDLAAVASVWNHGSIIRSWVCELAQSVLERDEFDATSGSIAENGTGKWTVDAAHEAGVPVPTIELALAQRAWSRQSGGNYATKMVALLRKEFGGHAVKKS